MKHSTAVTATVGQSAVGGDDGEGALALRPAEPADVDRIAAVWAAGWLDGHLGHVPPALIEQRTVERLRPLVADRVPDATVALVTVAHSPRLAGFSVVRDDELEQLYVAEELRGSGVADELMGRAERRVAERFERAWLAVVAGNLRAMSFYQRCGWRDAGPYDNPAETGAGVIMVPCRRFEKVVGSAADRGRQTAARRGGARQGPPPQAV